MDFPYASRRLGSALTAIPLAGSGNRYIANPD